MYSTPRKNGSSNTFQSPKKVALKGLYQDGIWCCNCKPRLPATSFLVRKEGPNKGRRFYTCQEPKEKGCGFFLWEEDAAPRMKSAILSNSTSDPAAQLEAVGAANMTNPRALDKRTLEGHVEASNRLAADLVKQELEEFGEWPLSVRDERSMVDDFEEESLSQIRLFNPETPRKAAKLDMFSTPGSKRKRDDEDSWPTPMTERKNADEIFTTPSKSRTRAQQFNQADKYGLMSPSVTPAPARSAAPDQRLEAGGACGGPDFEITQEVMELLMNQSLDETSKTAVQIVLNKYALRNQGVVRGRDITRIALKTKEAKVAELQQRVTELEHELEMNKVIIKHLKSDMAQSLSNRGRGRGRGRPPDS